MKLKEDIKIVMKEDENLATNEKKDKSNEISVLVNQIYERIILYSF